MRSLLEQANRCEQVAERALARAYEMEAAGKPHMAAARVELADGLTRRAEHLRAQANSRQA